MNSMNKLENIKEQLVQMELQLYLQRLHRPLHYLFVREDSTDYADRVSSTVDLPLFHQR